MASVADLAAQIEAQERFQKALVPLLLNKLGGKVTVHPRDMAVWSDAHTRFEITRTELPGGLMELELRDLRHVEVTIDTHRGRLELTRADIDLLHEVKAGRVEVTPK